jgi:hypothetical protein
MAIINTYNLVSFTKAMHESEYTEHFSDKAIVHIYYFYNSLGHDWEFCPLTLSEFWQEYTPQDVIINFGKKLNLKRYDDFEDCEAIRKTLEALLKKPVKYFQQTETFLVRNEL